MTDPQVFFRMDASQTIGSGHAMRCLSLANELKKRGIKVTLFSAILEPFMVNKIQNAGHSVVILPEVTDPSPAGTDYGHWLGVSEGQDAARFIAAAAKIPPGDLQAVVVDHYGIGEAWERPVAAALDAPIFAIDDLSNRAHHCAALIDTTYGKSAADYAGLIPDNAQTYIGPDYALLRPDFAAARPASLARRDQIFADGGPVQNILIAMGGVDQGNLTTQILTAIEERCAAANVHIHILIGGAFAHMGALKSAMIQSPAKTRLHHNISDVAALLSEMDLCIGASGSSTWERCCLGLPTINLVIADNQTTIADKLTRAGAIVDGGTADEFNAAVFNAQIFTPLLSDTAKLQTLSQNSRDICDGRGVTRTALTLIRRAVKGGRKVTLRLAETGDIRQVYDWQCLPETRRYANNPEVPTWDGHQGWMAGKLTDPECHFYLIQCDGRDAGSVRIDRQAGPGQQPYTVSIFIDPKYFGYGVASAALSILAQCHPDKEIHAKVHNDNTASVRLFTTAGYAPQGDEWYVLSKNQ